MQRIFAIRLRLAPSLGSDHLCISHPQLDFQFFQQPLEPARVSTGFHPHTHLLSLTSEVAIKLLRSLTVFQPLLFTISGFGIYKRNLLEARVIIASYNDHCPAPLYPSLFGWLVPPKFTRGVGAGVVMESIVTRSYYICEPETGFCIMRSRVLEKPHAGNPVAFVNFWSSSAARRTVSLLGSSIVIRSIAN